jgi:hypothetical protein
LKVTLPVGVPEPGLLTATVAVNVTESPKTGEALFGATPVVVSALLTVRDAAVDVADPQELVATTSYEPALLLAADEIVYVLAFSPLMLDPPLRHWYDGAVPLATTEKLAD